MVFFSISARSDEVLRQYRLCSLEFDDDVLALPADTNYTYFQYGDNSTWLTFDQMSLEETEELNDRRKQTYVTQDTKEAILQTTFTGIVINSPLNILIEHFSGLLEMELIMYGKESHILIWDDVQEAVLRVDGERLVINVTTNSETMVSYETLINN